MLKPPTSFIRFFFVLSPFFLLCFDSCLECWLYSLARSALLRSSVRLSFRRKFLLPSKQALGKLHVTQKTSYSLGHHICKSGHKSVYGITPFSFQLTHTFIDLSVSHSKCHRSTRQLRKPSKLGWVVVDCQMKSCVPSKPFGGHGCVLGIELTSTLDAYFT